MVDPAWAVVTAQSLTVHGVGSADLGAVVQIPLRLRYNSQVIQVPARIAEDK